MKAPRLPRIALLLALTVSGVAAAAPVAYTHATFHPISTPDVTGTLVVDGGRIVALGADVPVPPGATVVDLGGRQVWPGMIDAATDLGLVDINSVRGSVDTSEIGDFNPDLRAEVAFHAGSLRLLPTVAGGVLAANVVPDGELFMGRSAVMRLTGWTWEGMAIAAPSGQNLRFPEMIRPTRGFRRPDPEKFEATRKKELARLDELIGDARGYDRARRAAESEHGPAVAIDPKLEALRPLLAGSEPLFLWADEKTQIEKGLDWVKAQGLPHVVLVSGPDAAYLAGRLAAEKIPVVLRGTLRLPERSWEPYDDAYSAPARLHAAGVRFAFTDAGNGGSENARNLPFNAAMAVAFGLPAQTAHEALTTTAAEILGVADRIGSLAPGLEATFFVSDGDPLDIRSHVERVFVRGDEVDLERDPQRRLWELYRDRHAPPAATPTTPGGTRP